MNILNPHKAAMRKQMTEQYKADKERVKELGYSVLKLSNCGNDSTWSYSKNGKASGEGFSSEGAVIDYILFLHRDLLNT